MTRERLLYLPIFITTLFLYINILRPTTTPKVTNELTPAATGIVRELFELSSSSVKEAPDI